MRKIAIWLIAVITVLVELVVLCLLDWLTAWLIIYLSKWEFLLIIIDFFNSFLGECLELGVSVIISCAIALGIKSVGEFFIKKIICDKIVFKHSPTMYISYSLICLFLLSIVIIGIDFFALIGDMVKSYTVGYTFWGKVILFFDAIKDTYVVARYDNLMIYFIGNNSFLISLVALIFCSDEYPYKKETSSEIEV